MTAIVRGTVLYGLSDSRSDVTILPSIVSRFARFSYGVLVPEQFVQGIHPISKMYYDPFYGQLMCLGQMRWFVKKVRLSFL